MIGAAVGIAALLLLPALLGLATAAQLADHPHVSDYRRGWFRSTAVSRIPLDVAGAGPQAAIVLRHTFFHGFSPGAGLALLGARSTLDDGAAGEPLPGWQRRLLAASAQPVPLRIDSRIRLDGSSEHRLYLAPLTLRQPLTGLDRLATDAVNVEASLDADGLPRRLRASTPSLALRTPGLTLDLRALRLTLRAAAVAPGQDDGGGGGAPDGADGGHDDRAAGAGGALSGGRYALTLDGAIDRLHGFGERFESGRLALVLADLRPRAAGTDAGLAGDGLLSLLAGLQTLLRQGPRLRLDELTLTAAAAPQRPALQARADLRLRSAELWRLPRPWRLALSTLAEGDAELAATPALLRRWVDADTLSRWIERGYLRADRDDDRYRCRAAVVAGRISCNRVPLS